MGDGLVFGSDDRRCIDHVVSRYRASQRSNIPIVLGIFGYTYGSLLGVFFAGMLTKTRGNDRGNIIAMIIGFLVVAILSGLPNNIAGIVGPVYTQPGWLPVMEFPWWIFFGPRTFCDLSAVTWRSLSRGAHRLPAKRLSVSRFVQRGASRQ